jgi:hypothetical protein
MSANDFINMLVYRGDDFSMALTFKDLNQDPIDISGWTISFTVKFDHLQGFSWRCFPSRWNPLFLLLQKGIAEDA